MGVPYLKLMHGFYQIYRVCLPQEDLEMTRFFFYFFFFFLGGGYLATLLRLLGLKFVGVPQPQAMHRFSPNVQDMFTQR